MTFVRGGILALTGRRGLRRTLVAVAIVPLLAYAAGTLLPNDTGVLPPADQDGFTRWILRRLALTLPPGMVLTIKGPLIVDVTAMAGQPTAPDSMRFSLERPWRGCQQDRGRCEGIVASYLGEAREMLRQQQQRPKDAGRG